MNDIAAANLRHMNEGGETFVPYKKHQYRRLVATKPANFSSSNELGSSDELSPVCALVRLLFKRLIILQQAFWRRTVV